MNLQTDQTTTTADESAIRAFLHQMIDAWNRGSGEGVAAPFSETADFIAFEGTHLKGRKAIAAFNQQAFDTVVKGTHLEGEVNLGYGNDPDETSLSAPRTLISRGL